MAICGDRRPPGDWGGHLALLALPNQPCWEAPYRVKQIPEMLQNPSLVPGSSLGHSWNAQDSVCQSSISWRHLWQPLQVIHQDM